MKLENVTIQEVKNKVNKVTAYSEDGQELFTVTLDTSEFGNFRRLAGCAVHAQLVKDIKAYFQDENGTMSKNKAFELAMRLTQVCLSHQLKNWQDLPKEDLADIKNWLVDSDESALIKRLIDEKHTSELINKINSKILETETESLKMGLLFGLLVADYCIAARVKDWKKLPAMYLERINEWLDRHIKAAENEVYEATYDDVDVHSMLEHLKLKDEENYDYAMRFLKDTFKVHSVEELNFYGVTEFAKFLLTQWDATLQHFEKKMPFDELVEKVKNHSPSDVTLWYGLKRALVDKYGTSEWEEIPYWEINQFLYLS